MEEKDQDEGSGAEGEEEDEEEEEKDEKGRIWFPGNPWPNGHEIVDFSIEFTLDVEENVLRLDLHLSTDDYYAEDDKSKKLEEEEPEDDWSARVVWTNYHHCMISTSEWDGKGFVIGSPDHVFDYSKLHGAVFRFDQLDQNGDGKGDQQCDSYIHGHDEVRDHTIKFSKNPDVPHGWDIEWTGRVMRRAVRMFRAVIHGARLPPHVSRPSGVTKKRAAQTLAACSIGLKFM